MILSEQFRQASIAPKAMSKIVWIDMEMTGLNPHTDRIMEIACIITDNNLNVLAENPSIVIHQPDSLLDTMNEWCKTTHAKVREIETLSKGKSFAKSTNFVTLILEHLQTGLWKECQESKISETEAEQLVLNFLKENDVKPSDCPLAGNSVYMDRIFLLEQMPQINNYLNYRIIDVSSVKELCKRWNPSIFSRIPKKRLVHRGLDDIKESIAELQFYQNYMFKTKE